jgi:hypothetical protein
VSAGLLKRYLKTNEDKCNGMNDLEGSKRTITTNKKKNRKEARAPITIEDSETGKKEVIKG